MPFIVTTKRPLGVSKSLAPACKVSRHAVATLEEAKTESRKIVRPFVQEMGNVNFQTTADRALVQIEALTESGGSVGPLPDGTIIHVRAVGQDRMRSNLLAWHSGIDTRNALNSTIAGAWVDAFNARGAA